MLKSNESKDFGISNEELKRRYNTIEELDEELDNKLMKNAKGDQLQYIFSQRLNILFDKWKEEKKAEMVIRKPNEKLVLTKKEFATELDITDVTLSNYLSARAYPKPKEIKRLAQILNTSKEYLYGLTDSTAPIPPKSNLILGLSPSARYCLFKMYHGIEDEDVSDIDIDIPHSDKYIGYLEIFSEFIGNFTDFCDFVTYLKWYVETKQAINKLEKNKEDRLNYKGEMEKLTDSLIGIEGRLHKITTKRLDDIANKEV